MPDEATDVKRSFHFSSTEEAYVRASWKSGELLAGVRKGEMVIRAGAQAVIVDPVDWRDPPTKLRVKSVADDGSVATIACADGEKSTLAVELHRPDRLLITRQVPGDWQWSCQGQPVRRDNELSWPDGTRLKVLNGTIRNLEPQGYAPKLSVGYGKLDLVDPSPQTFPRCTVAPSPDGRITIEIRRP